MVCDTVTLVCSVADGMVRAEVSALPADCDCSSVALSIDDQSTGAVSVPEGGVVETPLPENCVPGQHTLQVTCRTRTGRAGASQSCTFVCPGGGVNFVRGDADANGSINLTDGIVILNFLFLGAAAPACMDAADTDDDGGARPTLTDAVIVFAWLFSGGNPPREPTPGGPTYLAEDCGADATADGMDCARTAGTCAN